MGAVTWLAGGLLALALARPLRPLRRSWKVELFTGAIAAMIAGVAATALDFGGWQELDWRAITFAFFAGFAAIAVLRLALAGRA